MNIWPFLTHHRRSLNIPIRVIGMAVCITAVPVYLAHAATGHVIDAYESLFTQLEYLNLLSTLPDDNPYVQAMSNP